MEATQFSQKLTLNELAMQQRSNDTLHAKIIEDDVHIGTDMLKMIQKGRQFSGADEEDPNDYLDEFIAICETQKDDGDRYRIKLIPLTIKGRV